MSLVGKIQSLFLDREKTQPIFPITKVKAVSDDNGKGLNVLLDDKASKDFVTAKIAEAQLGGGGGEIDLSGFATKDDLKVVDDKIPTTPEQIGAHPNTWMPTAADVGAAPAGYGYGEALPTVTGATDAEFLSNIEALCREKISFSTFQAIIYPPGSAFDGYSFIAEIWHRTDNNGNKFIKIKAHGVTATWAFQRVCYLNTWTEPEWVNPPMIPGVEYRTTERWNGKVVYTKLVNIGALPNATGKYIETGLLPMGITVITAYGVGIGGKHSLVIPTKTIHLSIDGEWGTIYIATSDDYSNYTGYIVAKYVRN